MSDAVADILDDAADLLERKRWIQETLADGEGGYCAQGAIYKVCGWGVRQPTYRRYGADDAEARLANTVGQPVPDWNDFPDRTKQQVLDGLRLAAKRERMDGAA